MRSLGFSRYLGSCAVAAVLAGCGGSQPPIGAPGAEAQSRAIPSVPLSWIGSPQGGPTAYYTGSSDALEPTRKRVY